MNVVHEPSSIPKSDNRTDKTSRPLASISLDLDDKWTYLKTHGDPWEAFPSYLELVVPRILEFLEKSTLRITFFIVGQDAEFARHHATLQSIADAGHEVGNHSFRHEPWLHDYTQQEVQQEIERAEEAIQSATGQRPIGFRGPGFSMSQTVLQILSDRGYRYDASTFPTFLGPAARAYYFLKSRLTGQQRKQRRALFGRLRDGLQSNRPFLWNTRNPLVEIPVTTMPFVKLPMHMSYLNYLSAYSRIAAKLYAWKSQTLCRLVSLGPSLLLHPLDFLGPEDESDLSFFPGMNLSAAKKIDLLIGVVRSMRKSFDLVTMAQQASRLATGRLRLRNLNTALPGRPIAR